METLPRRDGQEIARKSENIFLKEASLNFDEVDKLQEGAAMGKIICNWRIKLSAI